MVTIALVMTSASLLHAQQQQQATLAQLQNARAQAQRHAHLHSQNIGMNSASVGGNVGGNVGGVGASVGGVGASVSGASGVTQTQPSHGYPQPRHHPSSHYYQARPTLPPSQQHSTRNPPLSTMQGQISPNPHLQPQSTTRLIPLVKTGIWMDADLPQPPRKDESHLLGELLALWMTGRPTSTATSRTHSPTSSSSTTHSTDPSNPTSLFENPDLRTSLWRLRPPTSTYETSACSPPKTLVLEEHDRRRVIETCHPSGVRLDTIISPTQFLIHAELKEGLSRDDVCIRVDDERNSVYISGGGGNNTPSSNPNHTNHSNSTTTKPNTPNPNSNPNDIRPFVREVRLPNDVVVESMLAWVDKEHPVLVIDSYRESKVDHGVGLNVGMQLVNK